MLRRVVSHTGLHSSHERRNHSTLRHSVNAVVRVQQHLINNRRFSTSATRELLTLVVLILASIRLYATISLLLAIQEQEQVMRQLQASTKATPTATTSSKQRAPSSSVPAGNARLFEKRTPLKRPGAGTASTAATTAGAAKQSVGKQRPGVGFGSSTARAVVQTIKPTPVRKSSASSTHSAISRPEGRARQQQQQQQQLPQYAATDSSGNVAVVAGLSSGIQALLQRGGRSAGGAAPRMAGHYSEYDDSGANDAGGELGGDSRFVQDDQLDKLMARTSSRAAASSSGRGGVREGAWRAEY
jgi:hypothetical protein